MILHNYAGLFEGEERVMENIDVEVRKLVAGIIEMKPERIDADADLVKDLGMDSMMALEILAGLEKQFKIKIPEQELPKMTTLTHAIEVTKKYVK